VCNSVGLLQTILQFSLTRLITDYSLLHVQRVIPVQQHVSEMERSIPLVMSRFWIPRFQARPVKSTRMGKGEKMVHLSFDVICLRA
jgi:hypothetical protein